ncbi:transglycosylase SLT domain-containing protein [Bacteroidota bacterium]
MRKIIIICVAGIFINSINISFAYSKSVDIDTLTQINKELLNKYDSLTSEWYKAHPYQDLSYDSYYSEDSIDVNFPDSVFQERISNIHSIIPLSYNKIVNNFIKVYTKKRRKETAYMLGLTEYYFPIFEEILEEYGLPNELKYLPVIESGLNPIAVSKAGATGLWQFMFGTAKMYKLKVNSLIDERRDPIKSSHAAARFLKDLYSIYNDWILVIAAYNCGPGNVNKAIRRSGNKTNYWDIYYYLPRETRGYVPAFIAVNYVFNYYKEHNLIPIPVAYKIPIDTVIVREELHLKQVSEVLDISHSELRDLNPQYRWDIIPKNPNGNVLKIPMDNVARFIELEDSIFNYKDSIFFNPEIINQKPSYYSKYSPVTPIGKAKIYYTVKPGDNVGYIAEWYDVRASDLRYWNSISRNLIRVGEKLIVFVPEKKAGYYEKINSMSFNEKQKMAGFTVNASEEKMTPKSYELVYYTVKSGDTIWKIAQNYPGVTDYDIMQLNNINNASKINPGQTLKINVPVF